LAKAFQALDDGIALLLSIPPIAKAVDHLKPWLRPLITTIHYRPNFTAILCIGSLPFKSQE
jgi:hypothetical protein